MNRDHKVNKQEASRRQLNSAIMWFFEGCDYLPIYNISASVFVITENIAEKKGPTDRTFYGLVKPHFDSQEFKKIKSGMGHKHGFLKHADREMGEINDINEDELLSMLIISSENYSNIFGEPTIEMAMIKSYMICKVGIDEFRKRGVIEEYLNLVSPYELIYKKEGAESVKALMLNEIKNYKSSKGIN